MDVRQVKRVSVMHLKGKCKDIQQLIPQQNYSQDKIVDKQYSGIIVQEKGIGMHMRGWTTECMYLQQRKAACIFMFELGVPNCLGCKCQLNMTQSNLCSFLLVQVRYPYLVPSCWVDWWPLATNRICDPCPIQLKVKRRCVAIFS